MLVFVGWTILSMNLDGKDKTALKVHASLLQSKILAWNSFGGFHSGYFDKKCKDQWVRCNWNNFRRISPILTFLLRCCEVWTLFWSICSYLGHQTVWTSFRLKFLTNDCTINWTMYGEIMFLQSVQVSVSWRKVQCKQVLGFGDPIKDCIFRTSTIHFYYIFMLSTKIVKNYCSVFLQNILLEANKRSSLNFSQKMAKPRYVISTETGWQLICWYACEMVWAS